MSNYNNEVVKMKPPTASAMAVRLVIIAVFLCMIRVPATVAAPCLPNPESLAAMKELDPEHRDHRVNLMEAHCIRANLGWILVQELSECQKDSTLPKGMQRRLQEQIDTYRKEARESLKAAILLFGGDEYQGACKCMTRICPDEAQAAIREEVREREREVAEDRARREREAAADRARQEREAAEYRARREREEAEARARRNRTRCPEGAVWTRTEGCVTLGGTGHR